MAWKIIVTKFAHKNFHTHAEFNALIDNSVNIIKQLSQQMLFDVSSNLVLSAS